MKYTTLSVLLLAALLLTVTCRGPRETRSVHLPLAVGNRWLYGVESDSARGLAVIEVVSGVNRVFDLSLSSDTGHLYMSEYPLRVRCRDSVLWMELLISGKQRWLSVLSDDRQESSTQTLLTYRKPGGSAFAAQAIGTVVVGADTFRDCLRLSCVHVGSNYFFFGGGDDSTLVSEDYAPGVGLVRVEAVQHWRSWMWFPSSFSDSGTWSDRWELRDYRLSD